VWKTTSNELIKWYESGEGKEKGTIEKGTQVREGGGGAAGGGMWGSMEVGMVIRRGK